MKRLSVCMIVKNEEQLLPRCLESIKGLADEIIIVDTGSTDRTKEVAETYGAKVYEYVWSNNFAAARNESLKHATGKWILVLDADEYLSKDDHDAWKDFLYTVQPEANRAYTLPVVNFTGENEFRDEMTTAPVTRLFPNFKGIYFERPIHEQLTRGSKGALLHKQLRMNIYHTGYQTQRVNEKSKHERNMSIFNEMRKNQKLTDYDWFTLGNQYRYANDEEEALKCYQLALDGGSINAAWYPHCLMGAIGVYFKQGALKSSWEWSEKLGKYDSFPDYYTMQGIHYETMGFFEQAAECYLQAVKIGERRAQKKQEIWLVDPLYSFEVPALQLVEIYFRLNNNQQAIYWLSKLLDKNKNNPSVLLRLVEWLCQNEDYASVISFLDKTYDLKNKKDNRLLFKIALVLGQKDLVDYYGIHYNKDQFTSLDQIRYSVLMNDQEEYSKFSIDYEEEFEAQLQIWVQAAVGALKWGTLHKLNEITSKYNKKEITSLTEIITQLSSSKEVSELTLSEHGNSLFLVAKQLFMNKEFELFDRFVAVAQSAPMVNQLANYFYSLNLVEMAMNYYSVLLSANQLDVVSLVNLGLYHANHGYRDEAEAFFREAVEKQPDAKHLYVTLILQASQENKEQYINKFVTECPEYIEIPFVAEFIRKERETLGVK